MFTFILNPAMLAGLLGVGLPVLAHLMSRRKHDVVYWGAMQFLNPSRKTRRRMRLEELLLLLVRMATIAVIVFALSRLTASLGFLTGYQSAGSRDVVLVIDGSNSMGRTDGLTTLHAKAIRRAQTFLSTLSAGDTVAIIDARDTPIRLVESPLQDRDVVKQILQDIPPPAGAADLQRACEDAVAILGRSSNGAREVVVFTDRQRAGWKVANEASWRRFDDVLSFPAVRPHVWVVDTSHGMGPVTQNISVGQVDVSRDLTVPGFPVSFQVPIHNAGPAEVDVPIQVLVNGQRLANMDALVTVPAKSETTFSRSLRFSSEGTNLIGVQVNLESDAVAADNAGFAAMQVKSAVPVLLVEGAETAIKSDRNTFFAELALSAPENRSPWILARTVAARELVAEDLKDVSAVVLADVTELPDGMPEEIQRFAAEGNGVFITLGPETTPERFDRLYCESGLLPGVKLNRVRRADPNSAVATTVAPYSLEVGWLNRFRERRGATLLTAPFEKWWLIEVSGEERREVGNDEASDDSYSTTRPITIAQLTSGDPLLLQASCGRGSVLLMTSNIDAQWNALPTMPDYVPFLHEALFQMAASRVSRNLAFGQPLLTTIAPDMTEQERESLAFQGPFDQTDTADLSLRGEIWSAQSPNTRIPGVYHLSVVDDSKRDPLDSFVVNYDHAEDDPAEITADDRGRLVVNDRMTFVESVESLQRQMYENESRTELWALLLWMFLALLMVEVWMTRRLVMQGHADTPDGVEPITA